jgi:hypothetical protein
MAVGAVLGVTVGLAEGAHVVGADEVERHTGI